jgi:hypothetical protein
MLDHPRGDGHRRAIVPPDDVARLAADLVHLDHREALTHKRVEAVAHYDVLREMLTGRMVPPCSMNSRRTCGRAGGCCAARRRSSCARSSSAGCWRTTRCDGCCTKGPHTTEYRMPSCPSKDTWNCCDAHSPNPGPFPPERPRRRRRWFRELLQASARTRATRTLNRRSPRMVKRRNSHYAPHDRTAATRIPMDCTPRTLTEPPGTPMPRAARIQLWSPTYPQGGFST